MDEWAITNAVSAILGPSLLLVGVAIIMWDRRRARKKGPVADGPAGEPYRVYTREFDIVTDAENIPEHLEASLDRLKGWGSGHGAWLLAQEAAEQYLADPEYKRAKSRMAEAALTDIGSRSADYVAVTFLVDHSGSMRGEPILRVRAALEVAVDALSMPGVSCEVLGFSTLGWHGGRACDHWRKNGKPKRPGRLAALLHIIYKDAGRDWTIASRKMMSHPEILRENVDGEALRWAAERMRRRAAHVKVLIVISDGAPVDDATLTHNGEKYLERDLRRAIDEVEAAGDIFLGAVGIGYEVSRYYRRSASAKLTDLNDALFDQSIRMIHEASENQAITR